jgi:hypothetical protein
MRRCGRPAIAPSWDRAPAYRDDCRRSVMILQLHGAWVRLVRRDFGRPSACPRRTAETRIAVHDSFGAIGSYHRDRAASAVNECVGNRSPNWYELPGRADNRKLGRPRRRRQRDGDVQAMPSRAVNAHVGVLLRPSPQRLAEQPIGLPLGVVEVALVRRSVPPMMRPIPTTHVGRVGARREATLRRSRTPPRNRSQCRRSQPGPAAVVPQISTCRAVCARSRAPRPG